MIISIFTSSKTGAPQTSHDTIEAIASAGLAGDRYMTGQGFYSGVEEWDAHVTLVESEPFETLAREQGCILSPDVLRRNLVTRGVDLSTLIGREFSVGGDVVLRGRKVWPPCSHIVKHSGLREIFQYLAKHCGIGADVLVGGTITVGDSIRTLPL